MNSIGFKKEDDGGRKLKSQSNLSNKALESNEQLAQ
jgi:hypothetical protein